MKNKKKVLLAGTRVTGDMPHIGTYYGWIKQVKEAKKEYNVIILIADFQSLDTKFDYTISEGAQKLKQIFRFFIPDIPVIIESQIKDILKLSYLISEKMKIRYFKRVMPIRRQLDENGAIRFNMAFYPAAMVANILSLDAKYIFNKPEGKFQHSEVINDIINDLNKHFNLGKMYVNLYHKKIVNILSLDGTGPMKRNRIEHGIIEVYKTTQKEINDKLKNAMILNKSNINDNSCKVIGGIWNAVVGDEFWCTDKFESCQECIEKLAKAIWDDICCKSTCISNEEEMEIIKLANQRVQHYIQLLTLGME